MTKKWLTSPHVLLSIEKDRPMMLDSFLRLGNKKNIIIASSNNNIRYNNNMMIRLYSKPIWWWNCSLSWASSYPRCFSRRNCWCAVDEHDMGLLTVWYASARESCSWQCNPPTTVYSSCNTTITTHIHCGKGQSKLPWVLTTRKKLYPTTWELCYTPRELCRTTWETDLITWELCKACLY